MFARWWASEIESNSTRVQALESAENLDNIRKVISARRIMVNDYEEFHLGWPAGKPKSYLIWWPLRAKDRTLHILFGRVPEMKEQIIVACIFCNYPDLYLRLCTEVTGNIWWAAKQALNPFFIDDLEKKAAGKGINLEWLRVDQRKYIWADLEPTNDYKSADMDDELSFQEDLGVDACPYDGASVNVSELEWYVWATPELLRKIELFGGGVGRGVGGRNHVA